MRKLLLILSLNCLPLCVYLATGFQPSHLPEAYRKAIVQALGGQPVCLNLTPPPINTMWLNRPLPDSHATDRKEII